MQEVAPRRKDFADLDSCYLYPLHIMTWPQKIGPPSSENRAFYDEKKHYHVENKSFGPFHFQAFKM